ncbi:small polypeptide DEVIL 13-like [Impatiens glandulifera]|uniref:small polypeptide DEVIL 13-like n=1 Tax=Impatiens glandulifera TaxID=253017 RepID=UPI001FB1541B|nr:small polypeptide DEVIL 13-like [Impatiens glandulifera]
MAKGDHEFYPYYYASSSSSTTTSASTLMRSISQKTSSTNFKSPLMRTFSHKNSSSSSSYNSILTPHPLSKDCLQKSSSCSSSSSLSRQRVVSSSKRSSSSSSMKCSEIAHKCTRLVKEQRARFYIMKRCVKMLVCWGKHDGS